MDEYLRRAARQWPEKTALIEAHTDEYLSYEELDAWANRIAAGLVRRRIETGQPVGIVAARRLETIAAIWGVLRAGGIVVPLSPDETLKERQTKCDIAGVEQCLVLGEDGVSIPDTVDRWEIEAVANSRDGVAETRDRGPRSIDHTRMILFTSGTTGTPSGVRLTGRNLGASAVSTIERLGARSSDRWLLDLPLYHAGGLSIPIRTALVGATTVHSRSFEAEKSAETMAEYDVTGVSLVPTMLERLLDGPGVPTSLRFALIGGAATPPELVKRALAADVPIYASYGMTETASGIATATPAELADRPETVGRPVRAAQVRIEGADGSELEPGAVGEITVTGAIVSPGTVDGESRQPGEPLRTGDRGYLTAGGQLVVTGRIDDLIVTGGENVSPNEVEAALVTLGGVREAAILGLPDDTWGERVAAAVVPVEEGEDPRPEAIRNELRERLADYKLPKTVEIVESLPRTASGTVDRTALRKVLEEGDSTAGSPD